MEEATNESVGKEEEKITDKEINSKLRERVLRFWLAIIDRPLEIKMYEGTTVTGIFCATDAKQTYLQISKLKTPMYIYPEALVRSSDILSLRILSSLESKNLTEK